MSTALPHRPSTAHERRPSFGSFPHSQSSSSLANGKPRLSPAASFLERSPSSSQSSARYRSLEAQFESSASTKPRKQKSQYPRDSTERHVEYILVASFHIDRGPIMEHQYPAAISGDESMLAELMLPDQTHVRSQDWTIFFLHKDSEADEGASQTAKKKRKKKRKARGQDGEEGGEEPSGGEHGQAETDKQGSEKGESSEEEEEEEEEEDDDDDDDDPGEGPPLMYVLNLVNTKQDNTVRRGAVVKAMAICTRHSFLHIYKPILLLALEDYFKAPYPETLANLYDALNAMDLSLMPRFSFLERSILQASDTKDMFVEKFERMIRQRQLEDAKGATDASSSPDSPAKRRYAAPRDTHEFESKIMYNDIPVPVKVPTAIWPETVGDFSLVKLIQTFSAPHSTSPQPFALHPHLTSSGAFTHPIIVLVNAMITQKRVVFLGHNRPSGEVAEAVLAACALASGGILRGFTRHAFPYTDLTKIDDLLKVPGFVAGVTNPTFANHPEWWDLLCDLPTGRMKISSRIEPAPVTEGQVYFQQQNGSMAPSTNANNQADPTGDVAFMEDVLRAVAHRHGENALRTKWRSYIQKFTRIAAAFEETVYGASALYVIGPTEAPPTGSSGAKDPSNLASLRGHGYVWPDEASKTRELAAWVARIEGWRNTRSYYAFIQDVAAFYHATGPVKSMDLQHHHDRLRALKLSQEDSAAIYLAFSHAAKDYTAICQLLTVMPESQAGLFYLSLGLFHSAPSVREATVDLLDRVAAHEAGRHFWNHLGRFTKLAYFRVKRDRDAALNPASPGLGPGSGGNAFGPGITRPSIPSQPSQQSLVGVALGEAPSQRRS